METNFLTMMSSFRLVRILEFWLFNSLFIGPASEQVMIFRFFCFTHVVHIFYVVTISQIDLHCYKLTILEVQNQFSN